MKKVFTLIVAIALTISVFCQTPQKMSYQAVIRDASNALITSHAIGMRISILQGSVNGTPVYTETQTPTTNMNGLVSIEIGGGAGFEAINWASGSYFIKSETDPNGGTNYTIMGVSQILSVPYALYSKMAKTANYNDLTNKPILFDGTWTSLTGKPIYSTVATSGSYNDLINKPTLFSGNYNDLINKPILFDGTWTNITGKPTTLSGYGITNGMSTSHVANGINSTMITNWNTAYGWGNHAGLYRPITYLPTWSEITSIPAGFSDGVDNVDDADNSITNEIQVLSIVGPSLTLSKAGGTVVLPSDNWGTQNVVTDATLSGNGTTALPLKIAQQGASAGQVLKWTGSIWDNAWDDPGPWSETTNYIYNAESKNFGMGISVPTQKLTLADGGNTCYMNIQNSTTGYTSYDGMFLGANGLNSYVSTFESGSLYLGTNNTVRLAILSDGKVGIGTLSPANKLDVSGAANLNKGIATGPALSCNGSEAIWYDGTYFSWGYGGTWNYFKDPVGIDCQPGAGHMLAVNGVASKPGGGTWTAFSDIRLKDIHGNYERGLEDIIRLEPVRFNYKDGNELKLPSKSEYVGFIAQDVQKVFPETVTETPTGYLEFDMHGVNVAVINAIKELKAENDELKSRLEKLEAKIGK